MGVGRLIAPQRNLQGLWRFDNITEDTYTKLLLHFDGADASTVIMDMTGKTGTVAQDAQIDTAYYKFGNASLKLDGTNDQVYFSDSADWSFGTDAFTIDFWARFNSLATSQTFCSQHQDNTHYWVLYWASNTLYFQQVNGSLDINLSAAWTPSTNTWYHVALIRTGNTWRFFVDGTQVGSDGSDDSSVADNTGLFRIGMLNIAGSEGYLNGWIDEFRVSKGIARWTSNFTPPTSEYIYGGEDSSGNYYHLGGNSTHSSTTGRFGGGSTFSSASSQYITNTAANSLDITGSQTWLAWIKPTSFSVFYRFMGLRRSDNAAGRDAGVNTDGSLWFYITGLTPNSMDSTLDLVLNAWNHVAIIYNSSNNTVVFFVNGVKASVSVTGTPTANSDNTFSIGRAGARGFDYANMVIDEAAIFDRAWSDSEIKNYYAWATGKGAKIL